MKSRMHIQDICNKYFSVLPLPLSDSSQDSTSPAPGLPSPSLSHGKKTGQPSKLVDLGAAATFASQAASSQPSGSKPQAGTGGGEADPLFDIFGGFSSATAPAGQTQLQQPTSTQGQCVPWGRLA